MGKNQNQILTEEEWVEGQEFEHSSTMFGRTQVPCFQSEDLKFVEDIKE